MRTGFLMPRRIADHGYMARLRSNHLSNSTAPIANNHNRWRFTTCFTTILQKWRIFRFRHLCKYCSLTYSTFLLSLKLSNCPLFDIDLIGFFWGEFSLLFVSVSHMCYHTRTYSIQSFVMFCHLVNILKIDSRFSFQLHQIIVSAFNVFFLLFR